MMLTLLKIYTQLKSQKWHTTVTQLANSKKFFDLPYCSALNSYKL